MEEVIKEGSWKCPNCGGRNRGRDVKCGGCGQAREGVAFEYDEGAAAVGDGESLALARGGADWLCAYCGTSNRASERACRQCNAEAGEGRARVVCDVEESKPPASLRQPPPSAPGGSWGMKVAGGLLAVLLVLGFLATRRSAHELIVQSASWSRAVDFERQQPVIENGWTLPSGARELSRRSEVHHYNKVRTGTRQVRQSYSERVQTGTQRKKVGTKDLGNGYFKEIYENVPVFENRQKERWVSEPVYRSDPVYAPKLTYEVLKWKVVRTQRASGNDTSAQWPSLELGPGEREGKRTEVYSLELKDPSTGKVYEHEPDAALFAALRVGGVCQGELNGLGSLVRVAVPGAGGP
ncbi:MAG: hypothetical protein HY816_01550 [Candidatus Wallbacteria bacterium]|nr:hypothetical protein [Candidatus Wallbacteria bacterium]